MADERKPKIDLKSRLGRKTVSSPSGPSIPPPVGVPRSSIPVPPFATQSSGPRVDGTDPYAAVAASEAPKTQPHAIKVEMSEEVVQAQKKSRGKFIGGAAVAALIAGAVGFAIGGASQKAEGASHAVEGAQTLAKEVDEANAIAEQIAEVISEAQKKLAKGEYPESEISKLGGLRIPFEGMNLAGKGMGRFNGALVTMLISYTASVSAANKQKDTVQRVLSGSKKAVQAVLEQKENPKVQWSVYVTQGPYGPWANMQPVPKPFPVKKADDKNFKWPEKFEIKEGKKTHKLERYMKGDPVGESELIPIAPDTQGLVCPADTLFKIARELRALQTLLKGAQSANPDDESAGLLQTGGKLIEQLKGIGQPG